ncbi:MAG: hypothetical protein F6K00_33800 [Leptolyngbya sp. SIOISBB]|nr:hypothetical protein [Leptolyngbya sp. SIOISBB]
MTAADNLSERDVYLAELGSSDEDVEALLSGGADVDELIAAGVLDDDEPALQNDGEEEEIDLSPITLNAEEAWAEFQREQAWLIANGHKRPPVQI